MSDQMNSGHPPSSPVREIGLFTVPKSGLCKVRFLGAVLGIITHWTGKKSKACTGVSTCPREIHKHPKVWKGYAAVEVLDLVEAKAWRPAVLEVTERLNLYLGSEVLRGSIWVLTRRKGRRDREEVYGELVGAADPRKLRTDVNVQLVVTRVYRCLDIEWGITPLIEAPQLLSDSPMDVQPECDSVPSPTLEERTYYESDMMPETFRAQLRATGKLRPGKRPSAGGNPT